MWELSATGANPIWTTAASFHRGDVLRELPSKSPTWVATGEQRKVAPRRFSLKLKPTHQRTLATGFSGSSAKADQNDPRMNEADGSRKDGTDGQSRETSETSFEVPDVRPSTARPRKRN